MAGSSGKKRAPVKKRPVGRDFDSGPSTPTPTRQRLSTLDRLSTTMDTIDQQARSAPISVDRSGGLDDVTPLTLTMSKSIADNRTNLIEANQMVPSTDRNDTVTAGRVIRKATGAVRASPKPIDLSQIPEHVGNNQPEDIDQLTRWAWEQAAASGSNNITMLQAKFKPINKLRMREKARHGVYGPVALNVSSRHHLEGAIIQIIGKPQMKACLRCKSENGPFHLCTSVSGHQGGSCGNCVTGGNASKCSLRPTTSAHSTPKAVKNRIMAALKDPKKQMRKSDRIRTLATLTEKQVMAVAQTFVQAVSDAGGPAESASDSDDDEESEEIGDSE